MEISNLHLADLHLADLQQICEMRGIYTMTHNDFRNNSGHATVDFGYTENTNIQSTVRDPTRTLQI